MSKTTVNPLDIKGNPITIGSIVLVKGENSFTGKEGLVIDTQSPKEPKDGPIAVFFDREVRDQEFNYGIDAKWTGTIPTAENQLQCPRVVCFFTEELEVIPEFSMKNLIEREFGSNYHSLRTLKFPLVPETHLCQMERCNTGLMATKKTIINVWGTLCVTYTCEPCHKKWHRCRCDSFELKDPLPGAPLVRA